MSFNCSECGEYFDDPHVLTEEEILLNEFDLSPMDIAEALDSVGSISCPYCGNPEIEYISLD